MKKGRDWSSTLAFSLEERPVYWLMERLPGGYTVVPGTRYGTALLGGGETDKGPWDRCEGDVGMWDIG